MDWNASTATIGVLVGLAVGGVFGALAIWSLASLKRSGGAWKGLVALVSAFFAVGSLATIITPAQQLIETTAAESSPETTAVTLPSDATPTSDQALTDAPVTTEQDAFAFPSSPCYKQHRWVVNTALALDFVGAIKLPIERRAEFLATALGETPTIDLIRDIDVVARKEIASASIEEFLGVCVALTGYGLPDQDVPDYDLTGYLEVAE